MHQKQKLSSVLQALNQVDQDRITVGTVVQFPITIMHRSSSQIKPVMTLHKGKINYLTPTGAVIKGITVPGLYNRVWAEIKPLLNNVQSQSSIRKDDVKATGDLFDPLSLKTPATFNHEEVIA